MATNTTAIMPIGPFDAKVQPPGSKSLTNRALLLAALAKGKSTIRNVLLADDTQRMLQALKQLGFAPALDEQSTPNHVLLEGLGGRLPRSGNVVGLNLGNAGTAYRFLTAACCLGQDVYELDGIERMRQRPVGQLVDLLRNLGARIDYLGQEGYPPLRITGTGLRGGEVEVSEALSSQYISALLQVGPYCGQGLTLRFTGPVTSRPYVEMTLRLMSVFGVEAEVDPDFSRIHVGPGCYRGTTYTVEPDASNASYFLAAAAVVPGSRCTIEGLGKSSLQGDVGFADVLHMMGAGLVFGKDFITVMAPPNDEPLRGIDIDLNPMPDMAQTLAVVAVFAAGPTTIRNVENLRIKETDRLTAMRNELTKLGATVEINGGDITVTPPPRLPTAASATIRMDTYNDHRMAMSLAVAGLRIPGVVINDPGCVDKTFPAYFDYLARLGRDGKPRSS